MGLSMNTIKDFVGDVADDAKDALDDVLDRKDEPKLADAPVPRLPGAGTGIGTGTTSALHSSAMAAGGLAASATALAALPEQISRLTKQIEALMKMLESMPQPPAPGGSSKSKSS